MTNSLLKRKRRDPNNLSISYLIIIIALGFLLSFWIFMVRSSDLTSLFLQF